MIIRDFAQCEEILAGDQTILRELFNPRKDEIGFRYSLAQARVKSGETSQLHRMKTSEVYYILQGEGRMFIDDDSASVKAGQAIYVPPGAAQKISNIGADDLSFLCIVDPAWKKEDEEII